MSVQETARGGYDPGTYAVDPGTGLAGVHLEGVLLLRSLFTEPWAYVSPSHDELVSAFRPDASRLTLFHIIASGSCSVTVGGGRPVSVSAGDAIVVPYADRHVVRGSAPADPVRLDGLVFPPPGGPSPIVRHGGGGAETEIVCGYLQSDDPLFDPVLEMLPRLMVVRSSDGPIARWVEASIAYALERWELRRQPVRAVVQLAELLLAEVLRDHLGGDAESTSLWVSALQDPVVATAIRCIHTAPERRWTVDELAQQANVSRSVLDERFRQHLGRSPIRYLTDWRMRVAADLLSTTTLGILAVAARVGYGSEEAFSRAFKRAYGTSPGAWRVARAAAR